MWIRRESNYQSLVYDSDGDIDPPDRYVFNNGRIGEDILAGPAYRSDVDVMNAPSYGQYINRLDENEDSLKMDDGKFHIEDVYAVYTVPLKIGAVDSFLSPIGRNWGTY